eukprot:sb/3475391/
MGDIEREKTDVTMVISKKGSASSVNSRDSLLQHDSGSLISILKRVKLCRSRDWLSANQGPVFPNKSPTLFCRSISVVHRLDATLCGSRERRYYMSLTRPGQAIESSLKIKLNAGLEPSTFRISSMAP